MEMIQSGGLVGIHILGKEGDKLRLGAGRCVESQGKRETVGQRTLAFCSFGEHLTYYSKKMAALAGMAQWIECQPMKLNVTG